MTWSGVAVLGGARGDFDARLAAFPALLERLAGAEPASDDARRGAAAAGRPRRVAGRVLLVGDAAGYLDALTGEGIGAALAQAAVLAECLAAGRPGDYERAWRRVTRKDGVLTSRPAVVPAPAAARPAHRPGGAALPRVFTGIVNLVGEA